jgi:hypothetical protein
LAPFVLVNLVPLAQSGGTTHYIRRVVQHGGAANGSVAKETAVTRWMRKLGLVTYLVLPVVIVIMHLTGWRVTADAAVGMVGMATAGAPMMMGANKKGEMLGALLALISVAIGLYALGKAREGETVEVNAPVTWWVTVVGYVALYVLAEARREPLSRDWPRSAAVTWVLTRSVAVVGVLAWAGLSAVPSALRQRGYSWRGAVSLLISSVLLLLLLTRSVP